MVADRGYGGLGMTAQESWNEFEDIARTIEDEGRIGRTLMAGFLGLPVLALGMMFIGGQTPVTGELWEPISSGIGAIANAPEPRAPLSQEIQLAGIEPVWVEALSNDVVPMGLELVCFEEDPSQFAEEEAQCRWVILLPKVRVDAEACRDVVVHIEKEMSKNRLSETLSRSS